MSPMARVLSNTATHCSLLCVLLSFEGKQYTSTIVALGR